MKKEKSLQSDEISRLHQEMEIIQLFISEKVPLTKIKLDIVKYLIKNSENKISISKLSKDLKIDYKNTWRYVNDLKKIKIVTLNPNKPSQGKKVFVSFNPKVLSHEEELKRIKKRMLKLAENPVKFDLQSLRNSKKS